ncbi:MAG: 1,2-phenylacetyl-CoA epoxidase subunit PaaD [Ferruginibacter sp.]
MVRLINKDRKYLMNEVMNILAEADLLKQKEVKDVYDLLEEVCDPEVPVLSILDLGIVRDVIVTPSAEDNDRDVTVTITPTYSGCPAMDMIAMNIRMQLLSHGYKNIKIISVLSPAWTTEWMTEKGKSKLKEYGIAAPHLLKDDSDLHAVECPQCNSRDTKLLSQFGSTACKALYQCISCKEPFDYFKCH